MNLGLKAPSCGRGSLLILRLKSSISKKNSKIAVTGRSFQGKNGKLDPFGGVKPHFEGGVRKRRSGSTLSPSARARVEGKPWPPGRGVEGLSDRVSLRIIFKKYSILFFI